MLIRPVTWLLCAALFPIAACESAEELPGFTLGDASNGIVVDSAAPAVDASPAVVDAAPTPMPTPDAGSSVDASAALDAGSSSTDASAVDAASEAAASDAALGSDTSASADAASTGPGVCGGKTPHGCWPPKAGNPMGCPAQIHEQSEFYPPLEEWEACSSPYYTACIYMRPDASEANCSCDLGLHWLCTY